MAPARHIRPTARQKLEKAQEREIVVVSSTARGLVAGSTLLIPTPLDVDGIIREIPHGAVTTSAEIRKALAARHGADAACPLCTGIFVRISAEAAMEDEAEGRPDITPFWRVLAERGRLNPKLPGGVEEQARRLRREGFTILPGTGKQPPQVANFQAAVFSPTKVGA